MKSSQHNYGTVAVCIHWISAIFIFVLLGTGMRADGTEDALAKIPLLRVHVALGVSILILTLLRIGWWWFRDKKPAPLPMPRIQERLSHAVHVLIYIVILGMAASGVGLLALSGAGSIIYGGAAENLPNFWEYAPRTPHAIGAKLMVGLLVLHAGAALYHQLFLKDGLLKRMWF